MDKLLLRPTEAAAAIGVGRSKVYELLARGDLPSVRVDGRLRIPVAGLRDWVEEKVRTRATSTRNV